MRRKMLFAILALPFVLSLGLVLYGKYGNHRGTIERLVTHALGRRLSIAGSFEADVGFTTRLVAEEITLANAPWSSEPSMVQVSHISGSIDLWSLIRGPVRIDDLRVDEARVVLEVDAEGRANWEFGPDDVGGADGAGVVLGRGKLRDVTVSYRDVARETPLEIGIDELELRGNEDGLLDLDLSGRINGIPVEMKGRIGTLDNLLAGTDVEPRLTGHVGDSTFTLHGRIANLDGLASPDLELEMQGPDLAALMRTLGLPS